MIVSLFAVFFSQGSVILHGREICALRVLIAARLVIVSRLCFYPLLVGGTRKYDFFKDKIHFEFLVYFQFKFATIGF